MCSSEAEGKDDRTELSVGWTAAAPLVLDFSHSEREPIPAGKERGRVTDPCAVQIDSLE